MKKVKKMIVLGMVVLSLMSALTFSVFSAGNVSDTIINISARSNNGGTPCRSIWREKKDYTSVWCENKNTSGGSLSAWVQRTNNKNTSSVKTVDRYYGSWSYNGATKNMKNLPKGTYYYLPNYVKEDGYKYATLGYIMNKEAVSYHIAWSPDSI